MNFNQFIEENRQQGSTTSLVETAIVYDGYLVVHNLESKKILLRKHKDLKADRVFTLGEIKNGSFIGREKRQVFVDAACMC